MTVFSLWTVDVSVTVLVIPGPAQSQSAEASAAMAPSMARAVALENFILINGRGAFGGYLKTEGERMKVRTEEVQEIRQIYLEA